MQEEKNTIFRYIAPGLAKQDNLAHGFFTRIGGISSSVYKSLNCNVSSADSTENVTKNRKIICNTLGFAYNNLKTLNQVHSTSVITISDAAQATEHLRADALVTALPNILLGIKTADCVPILFFDIKRKILAAAHAGWKGAISGIIDNTVFAMQSLGAEISNIVASIGPCIQQESYEVDQVFYDKVIEKDILDKRFFINSVKAEHYMFNLPGYCLNRLKKIGIQTIDNLGIDTYSNPSTLFSFRRATHENKNPGTKIEYGTQLSVIGIL